MSKTIRNPIAVAMVKRYGHTTSAMKDRRQPRGGTKNYFREFLDDVEETKEIQAEVSHLAGSKNPIE
jgi:hypothetical protein